MNHKETDRIKESLREKTSDELLDIWIKNDRSEWTDEAFIAVRDLLSSRNVPVPKQKVYNHHRAIEKLEAAEKVKNKGWLFVACGLLVVLVSYFMGSRIIFPIGLIAVGAFIYIKRHNQE